MKKNKGMIIGFLAPAVLIFLAVFLYPIVRTVIMSFFKISSVTDSVDLWKFVGIENYQKLFATDIFRTSMMNIGKIWLLGGIIVMTVSLLFAVILTSGIRGKKIFRAIIYLPNIVSAVALATMWLQYVYSPRYGLLKDLFTALHLDNLAKIQFLDNDHKFWALLFAYCFGMVGYHMLIWLSGIERISPEYYEAAKVDGANAFQRFFKITLPSLSNVMFFCFITLTADSWKIFNEPFMLQGPGTSNVSLFQYMYESGFNVFKLGYASSIGCMLTLILLIVSVIQFIIRMKQGEV